MSGSFADTLFLVSAFVLPTLLAITLHEAAHGFAAALLGDDTAQRMGRVSLNPLRHVDPFGTVLLPAVLIVGQLLTVGDVRFLFGYAKPVPVNFARLGSLRRDMMLVAAAGPATNLLLAFMAALALRVWGDPAPPGVPLALAPWSFWADLWIALNLLRAVQINLVLMLFNLLPILPLDGGRILFGLLPRTLALPYARTEPYGIMLVLGVFLLLPELLARSGIAFRPLDWLLSPLLDFFLRLVFRAAGY